MALLHFSFLYPRWTMRSWLCLQSATMVGILFQAEGSARGTLRVCPIESGGQSQGVVIDDFSLLPPIPRAGLPQSVQVSGRIHSSDEDLDMNDLTAALRVEFCNRIDDCLVLYETTSPFCEMANISKANCSRLKDGKSFFTRADWKLPVHIIRGSYNVGIQISKDEDSFACYTLSNAIIAANLLINRMLDHRDAMVAFVVAASCSRQLGRLFPHFSYGMLPQISGFIFIGVVVGPYATNLVSHYHIFLLGKNINRLSLSFIAGAAGAEIFLPELTTLIKPMLLQVGCITVATLMICSVGLITISLLGTVSLPMIAAQASFPAQVCISLLAACLMTARSPASAIAVCSEMQINNMKISKMILGITVIGDVVVLVLFALCTNLTRVVTKGGSFGPGVLVNVFVEIMASCLLGALASQALRLVLPYEPPTSEKEEHRHSSHSSSESVIVGFRGFTLIGILFCVFLLADNAATWSDEAFHLEPLLACTVASCICGHDEGRRHGLGEALGFWTPILLLPFFTLAGASLQLFGLWQVLPGAVSLVCLRMLSIGIGSYTAGKISIVAFPELKTSPTAVRCTWMTLIAQAGVTLGLVLEVQETFPGGWGHDFSTLVIGVVVLNQLLGPVLCRLGLTFIVPLESDVGQRFSGTFAPLPDEEDKVSVSSRVSSGIVLRQCSGLGNTYASLESGSSPPVALLPVQDVRQDGTEAVVSQMTPKGDSGKRAMERSFEMTESAQKDPQPTPPAQMRRGQSYHTLGTYTGLAAS